MQPVRSAARFLAQPRSRRFAFMPTQMSDGGLIVVASPFTPAIPRAEERSFSLKAVPPLLGAIRDASHRPHRIISYQTEDGKQFNAAYFDDNEQFSKYKAWFEENAVTAGGRQHEAWKARYSDPAQLPTSTSWLWGVGQRVLSDTRQGETQLGHGHRYSRMMFRDAAAKADAEQAAVDPQFEAGIAREMEEEGINYYGRLVMSAPPADDAGSCGGWFTKSRYGTLEEAKRGTWLIKTFLFKDEMAKWFSSYETVTGSIASTHLITPKWPDGMSHSH